MAACVLIVDDDPGMLTLLSMRLKASGYRVQTAESGEQALALMPVVQPQVVITDQRMDGMDGLTLFQRIQDQNPVLPVIILTAHGAIADAVAATRSGVFEYLTKPFDSATLMNCVARALRMSGNPRGDPLSEEKGDQSWRADCVTRSPIMDDLLRQAKLVAASDVSVLIQGESGTGKEVLARAIHKASTRHDKPFVAINCSAIPETLLESELFGHSKGSFTGAVQARKGLFQTAEGGTLFLDEIGDVPISFQAKLLRALQEREVRPVGANDTISIDVRVISATHQNLDQAILENHFREDLYYRLNVIRLELPSLSKRPEDIPVLVAHFLQACSERTGKSVKRYSPEAMDLLVSASWPGNVRHLQNVVEQTVALSTTVLIPASLVQNALRIVSETLPTLASARNQAEREYLVRVLQIADGNVSQAARIAERNRTEFYKLLQRHHLDPKVFRGPDAQAEDEEETPPDS